MVRIIFVTLRSLLRNSSITFCMKFFNQPCAGAALLAASGLIVGGCVDEAYDLDNLDTTMRIEVKDLVLPLNLEPVEFSSVIDLTDNDCVTVDDNGDYVLSKSGDFTEVVKISSISADPVIPDANAELYVPLMPSVECKIPEHQFKFSYSDYVDSYLIELESGKVDFDITLTLSCRNNSGKTVVDKLQNFAIGLPAGLYGYYYSQGKRVDITPQSASHVATYAGEASANGKGEYQFVYHVTDVDLQAAGASFTKGYFSYSGSCDVIGGSVLVTNPTMSGITVDVSIAIGHIDVHAVTGTVEYPLTDIENQYVSLDDLPDVLTDPETRIVLNNPQIYVEMNNPLATYGFKGSLGVEIRQKRPAGQYEETARLDGRLQIRNNQNMQQYLLTPNPDNVTPVPGFKNAEKLAFPGLDRIIYGNGLPQGIDITFIDPRLDRSHVVDFPLGVKLGDLYGSYELVAPLSFGSGSQVIYTGEQGGWGLGIDEELEIESLSVMAHLKSDLPVDLSLSAYPIDENGKIITDNGENVEVVVEPAVIPSHADENIVIKMKGSIQNLDGIRYTVRIAADNDAATLRPDMNLSLTDIKVKVSGYYESVDDND